MDEKYVDEIKTKESALERRPEAGETHSGQIYDQEDRQDRGVLDANEKRPEKKQ